MNSKTKRVAFLGLLTSFALVLSYIELLLGPVISGVPGIKIGLPNIIVIFLLYKASLKEAALVSLVRIVLITFLFGNFVTFLYSLAGAAFSIAIMFVLKQIKAFSTVGVSIAGGVAHNLAQICVAIFLLETVQIAYYAVVLIASGIISGTLVGLLGAMSVKYIEKIKLPF